MRFIGSFPSEAQALGFFAFLSLQGLQTYYEKKEDAYLLWVHREEDIEPAKRYYEEWKHNPSDPRFVVEISKAPPLSVKKKRALSFTQIVLFLCTALFLICTWQEMHMPKKEMGITPLQQALFFDDPQSMQDLQRLIEKYSLSSIKEQPLAVQKKMQQVLNTPFWKGALHLLTEKIAHRKILSFPPMFEKIRQGEVWRIISPSFLHRDFLHLLFNMAWLLILGRLIEVRIKMGKMVLLIVLLAAFSNTAQYLMSGPYFLGFSGVVAGLAGFIWSRQKIAPEDGYPLHRSTILFFFYLVLVLSVIGVICFFLQTLAGIDFGFSIANTAHISGGLLGVFLGRLRFFSIRYL
jgi:GlpG protein